MTYDWLPQIDQLSFLLDDWHRPCCFWGMKKLTWSLLFLVSASPLLGLDYKSEELGFKAKLPDGLEDISPKVGQRGSLIGLAKWKQKQPKKELVEIIVLQDMGAPIPKEDASTRKDKPANVTFEKARWKNFDINVYRVLETGGIGAVSNLTFNASVPLKPHAIRVSVTGRITDEADLRKEMQEVVASIEGKTNWPTTE
ncbi:MAG: hypothetical protein JWR26_4912 [Pedosphaera sp.]|nr:hypothetical protein [Pedosphaera sp.]